MLPQAFIQQIAALLGHESEAFFAALRCESPTSIRRNPSKHAVSETIVPQRDVPWCEGGCYLAQRPLFTLDPTLHGGAYYVQEASSMFVAQAVAQLMCGGSEAVHALDLCAAPGGKSTLLADFLPHGSLLVANEAIRGRVSQLTENITKWGKPNVMVTHSDPKDFSRLAGFFDLMLVDAPCSGEGMFRKDGSAAAAWSEANVQLCAERQRRIVADAWPALREGGLLLYSTCTFNPHENENNVLWMAQQLGATPAVIALHEEWGVEQSALAEGCYRFFPHRVRGEGFFIAALRKTSHSSNQRSQTIRRTSQISCRKSPVANRSNPCYHWLAQPDDFIFRQKENAIIAIPAAHAEAMDSLSSALRVVQRGLHVGELKGADVAPHAALALSTALRVEAFPTLDLDLRNALLYLKRDTFACANANASKGFELVRYNGLPLGFAKNLGTRRNNLFPSEWRIRMEI